MEKINILTILVAIVLMVVVVQTIQLTLMSQQKASVATSLVTASQTGNSEANAAGIDTSQMTADEKMNYEMHGVIPARFGSSSGSASNGLPDMVGGC